MNGYGGVFLKELIGFNYKILGCYRLILKLCLIRVSIDLKVFYGSKGIVLNYMVIELWRIIIFYFFLG